MTAADSWGFVPTPSAAGGTPHSVSQSSREFPSRTKPPETPRWAPCPPLPHTPSSQLVSPAPPDRPLSQGPCLGGLQVRPCFWGASPAAPCGLFPRTNLTYCEFYSLISFTVHPPTSAKFYQICFLEPGCRTTPVTGAACPRPARGCSPQCPSWEARSPPGAPPDLARGSA